MTENLSQEERFLSRTFRVSYRESAKNMQDSLSPVKWMKGCSPILVVEAVRPPSPPRRRNSDERVRRERNGAVPAGVRGRRQLRRGRHGGLGGGPGLQGPGGPGALVHPGRVDRVRRGGEGRGVRRRLIG